MRSKMAAPECSNCITHEQEFIYGQGPKKLRPPNDHIERLEAETQRLRNQLQRGATCGPTQRPTNLRWQRV